MTKDEALKLALEALESTLSDNQPYIVKCGKAITAIKEALAQPEQEPIARVIDNGTPEGATEWIPFTNRVEPLKTGDLLYGEPPERTWVGLTHEEHMEIMKGTMTTSSRMAAVEAKLKDKNTTPPLPVQLVTWTGNGSAERRDIEAPRGYFFQVDRRTQPDERNFCSRCGKRTATADLVTIHTCTPPRGNA